LKHSLKAIGFDFDKMRMLISFMSDNSRFGNSSPLAKATDYSSIINQSPKLQCMATSMADAEGVWGDFQICKHHEAMVGLLEHDVGLNSV